MQNIKIIMFIFKKIVDYTVNYNNKLFSVFLNFNKVTKLSYYYNYT